MYLFRTTEKVGDKEITKTIPFDLEVEPCTEKYFVGRNLPSNLDVDKLYCLSADQSSLPDKMKELNINGRFDSTTQGRLNLTIHKCQNQKCKSEKEIDDFLKKANVAVYYSDFGLRLDNRSHPFYSTLTGLFTSIDSEFSKNHELFMKTVVVETDDSLITSNNGRNSTRTITHNQRESVSSNRGGRLYSLIIEMSATKEHHIRKYRKIFYFVAQVGGYIKAFMLFGFLYSPFLKRRYYIDLINHLYHVDGGEALRKDEIEELNIPDEEKNGNAEDGENLIVWRKFDFFGVGNHPKEEEGGVLDQKKVQDESVVVNNDATLPLSIGGNTKDLRISKFQNDFEDDSDEEEGTVNYLNL